MPSDLPHHRPTSTDEGRTVAAAWGAAFFLGLLIFLGGVFCYAAAAVTSLASILYFGMLLIGAGIVEIVFAFKRRRSGVFLLYFLAGLLSLVVGGLFVLSPLEGLSAVTLLLAGYFFASGLFRAITSLMDRYPSWGLDFLSGAVSVVLGALLLRQWPQSSVWLLGVLVAVELMMRGATMMGLALALRRGLRSLTA